MKNVFDNIDRLKAELDSLLPLTKDINERLQKKIRLEFNYNSNHIEGNTLTYGETQLLLIYGKVSGDFDIRELDEMKAHDIAYSKIVEWAKDEERDITETDIKTLNELILIRPFWKEALTADGQPTRRKIQVGEYKEHANSVRLQNGEIFHYASVIETPMKMQELMSWYNQQKTVLHPVQLAAEFHHKFVLIHPFDDGNGRIARLIVNYMLLRRGYPPIIIKSADKKNYLLALNKADTGDLTAFITYIAEQLDWALKLNISAANGEIIEEDDDWIKKIEILKKHKGAIKKRTKANTAKFIHDIYPQFINKIESKLYPYFQEIFLRMEHSFSFSTSSSKKYKFSNKEQIASVLLSRNFYNSNSNQNLVSKFNFSDYTKNGFKSFNLQVNLILNLEEYAFRINIEDSRPILHIGIEEPINEDHIKDVVKAIGKKVVEKIEANLK